MLGAEEVHMKTWIIRITAVVLSLPALEVAFGKLLDTPRGRNLVRAFNRRVLNPLMVKKAGRGRWYASTIETTGRRTGLTRVTPVVADPVVGGFVIPLPYGEDVDWLKNARASHRAVIHHHDVGYPVDRFDTMGELDAAPLLTNRHRRAYQLTGVDTFLRAHLSDGHVTFVQ
jgi:hypothetical protein